MFRAVLDTCVLWPSLQRDLLLTMASFQLYEPLWSDMICLELEMHEQVKLIRRNNVAPSVATQRARRLVRLMNENFPDAQIRDTDLWEPPPNLPDPDDAHVLAAAEKGRAGAIVTDNLRDFPSAVVPEGVEILTPRDFLADTIGINPYKAYLAVEELLQRLKRPRMTFDELLHALETRYGCTEAVELLRLGERRFNKLVDGDS